MGMCSKLRTGKGIATARFKSSKKHSISQHRNRWPFCPKTQQRNSLGIQFFVALNPRGVLPGMGRKAQPAQALRESNTWSARELRESHSQYMH
eukprot:1161148-Pelagomonas_calceolata.AAC.7